MKNRKIVPGWTDISPNINITINIRDFQVYHNSLMCNNHITINDFL